VDPLDEVPRLIGVLAGSGVWLILRPRTFQVIVGLSLLSYAVNLFIIAMGRLRTGAAPILAAGGVGVVANARSGMDGARTITMALAANTHTCFMMNTLRPFHCNWLELPAEGERLRAVAEPVSPVDTQNARHSGNAQPHADADVDVCR